MNKYSPSGVKIGALCSPSLNLQEGYIVDTGNEKRSAKSEWEKYGIPLNERTILYSIDGTIGNMARYRGEKCILGKGACYIKLNDTVDADYIYYLLQSNHFNGYLKTMQTGSTIHHISLETMRKYPLPALPSIELQHAIGGLLAIIDSKIANNKRLMTELEETARLIFDYWFTQFDFPDESGKPYRSSGGKMVWSEELKREIPERWSVGALGDCLHLEKDTIVPVASQIYEHYSIPAYDDGKYPSFDDGDSIESGKYRISRGCALYSKLNPKFKRLWRPYCFTDNAICSTEFLVMKPNRMAEQGYCLGVLHSDAFYSHMVSRATSSTGSRSRVDPEVAIGFNMPHPDDNLIEQYGNMAMPLYDRIQQLEIESHELASLRDWLLPMLMNGQLVVD